VIIIHLQDMLNESVNLNSIAGLHREVESETTKNLNENADLLANLQ
jgi:energy-converting hydrogenase A subunit M